MISDVVPVLAVALHAVLKGVSGGFGTAVDLTVGNSVGDGIGTGIGSQVSGANGTTLTPVETSGAGCGVIDVTHTV